MQQSLLSVLSNSSSIATAAASITAITQQQQRYGHSHRTRFIGGSNQILNGHKNNLLNSYAPTSLPIELNQINCGTVNNNGMMITDHSSLSCNYQNNFKGVPGTGGLVNIGSGFINGVGVGNNIIGNSIGNSSSFTQFSMTDGTAMPLSISVPQTSNVSARASGSNKNDHDESPMVGVCVQQSPVVIH